jgi:CheY-like chemotaxis protein
MPRRAAGSDAPGVASLPGPAPLGTERILVADDDASVRAAVVRILEAAGYAVVAVRDGAEALTALARERFDLVLLDVVMPKLGGFKTYLRLRELHPGLPCLFATGYTPELLPELNASDTPIEVLAKPFEPEELLRAIRRALS